jgi:hypothetical protein
VSYYFDGGPWEESQERGKYLAEIGGEIVSEQPTFKSATCRGSYMLGSACGHCERCDWERKKMESSAAPPAPTQLASPETGWLIECEGPQWLCGFGFSANWTRDSLEAIRFSRRVDAEKIAEVLENCDIRITEHQWG